MDYKTIMEFYNKTAAFKEALTSQGHPCLGPEVESWHRILWSRGTRHRNHLSRWWCSQQGLVFPKTETVLRGVSRPSWEFWLCRWPIMRTWTNYITLETRWHDLWELALPLKCSLYIEVNYLLHWDSAHNSLSPSCYWKSPDFASQRNTPKKQTF